MKRLIAMLMLIITAASPTVAQTMQDGFARPADVPAYVESFNGYEAGTTPNVLGDGSNAWGGTMPVEAFQLADIPSTATGWKTAGSSFNPIPPGNEAKFRTTGNACFIAPDDPVRNYGAPGTSHPHQFFGNCTVNAYSTYPSMRNRANQYSTGTPKKVASTVAGGPYNATGYWVPCFIKTNPFANGKNYCVKINNVVIYYVQGGTEPSRNRLPRGVRYVTGRNMDDPDGASVLAEIAAANAQPGTAGRYSRPTNTTPKNDGFYGWTCKAGSAGVTIQTTGGQNYSQWIKGTDGSDPWGGACLSGYTLYATLAAPDCYDARNLWAPGGYKNFRHDINDTAQPGVGVCPKGWVKVPRFHVTVWYYHKGFSDYGNWRLSSDDAMQAKLTALGTPRAVANGESMHTDWMGAWDDTVFFGSADGTVKGWQRFCSGVKGNTPNDCDSSTINATENMVTGNAPDVTRTPQVNLADNQYDTSVPTGMHEIPAKWTGPITLGNQ